MGVWSDVRTFVRSICTCRRGDHHKVPGSMSCRGVQLRIQDCHVVIDNGILQVTLSNPEGLVTGVRYNGLDNVLEVLNHESNRGYWDVVWSALDGSRKGAFEVIKSTSFRVVVETEEQVEVSFFRPWDPSLLGKLAPINIDKRFVLLRGSSGFYTYAIYEHLGSEEWQGFSLGETRIAFKLRKDKFHYMAVADDRKRYMPLPEDRLPGRSEPLAFQEAVSLVNPVAPEFKGEVDDKYQYTCENRNLMVHGWISNDPPVGFWQITPSNEFRTGGPLKQNLCSHVGPTCLAVFVGAHYAGDDLVPKFGQGEPWKKVFGPIFIYLNSARGGEDPCTLWEDAKRQMMDEVKSWPYSFPASEDFPKSHQRGHVRGRLLVRDRYVCNDDIPARGAYIGLAPPGDVGSWQRECKDYQFWTQTDETGDFTITNVRVGDYNLYAWVPGFLGDYRNNDLVTIAPGCDINVGNLVYEPPRDGPTLWEIGIPDRSAAEFYVPEPNPKYVNRLFINNPESNFRQYGLWERYAELYPHEDLVFTVGESDYRKDWFYAQVPRRKEDNSYVGTTWQIRFKLEHVERAGTYKLRLALAGATLAEVQVRVNDPNKPRPIFTTRLIGRDNAVARHGIHGLYWLYNVDVSGALLTEGENTIYLTQPRNQSPFQGIMYDYIRLEAPPHCS